MSIASELTRLQNAKASIKSAIENNLGQTVPSSAKLDGYSNYIIAPTPSGWYTSKPTANGVYIKWTDGTYSDYNVISDSKTPVGVGLITSNTSIIIHPNETDSLKWTANAVVITNCTTAGDKTSALLDFAGKSNTDAVISQVGAGSAPVFNWARNVCTYADGSIGYLPSLGQLDTILLNLNAINAAMVNIHGTPVLLDTVGYFYFSSTQNNRDYAWGRNPQYIDYRTLYKVVESASYKVRSVADF